MNQEPKLGWSWGAFMYNIAWGVGNKAYLTFLVLIPVFNIIWIFVCGACGKRWAWNSGMFATAEEFNVAQRTWDRAGLFAFIAAIVILAIYLLFTALIIGAIIISGSYY